MIELIWGGKYDKTSGKKVALPFQTVEAMNESADESVRRGTR